VGAAFFPQNGVDAEGLLAEAERRMCLVKPRFKRAVTSPSIDLANLAAQIEKSPGRTPHATLLQ